MKYSASEKLEPIRFVEQSYLPVSPKFGILGIPGTTFYRSADHYQAGGPETLEVALTRPAPGLEPHPERDPEADCALDPAEPDVPPQKLAADFTDTKTILSQRLRSIACTWVINVVWPLTTLDSALTKAHDDGQSL